MSDLKRLERLDPELAAWWRVRREEAWAEIGLTREPPALPRLIVTINNRIPNLTTLIESFGQAVIRVAGITARGLEQFEQGRRKPSKMLVLPTQPVNPPSPTAVELANGIDITEHVTGIDIQWEANQ